MTFSNGDRVWEDVKQISDRVWHCFHAGFSSLTVVQTFPNGLEGFNWIVLNHEPILSCVEVILHCLITLPSDTATCCHFVQFAGLVNFQMHVQFHLTFQSLCFCCVNLTVICVLIFDLPIPFPAWGSIAPQSIPVWLYTSSASIITVSRPGYKVASAPAQ